MTTDDSKLVLDVEGGVLSPGTPVIVWGKKSPAEPNQLWTLTSDGYLQCQSDPNLVLDAVGGGVLKPGTPLIVWTKKRITQNNQWWYYDDMYLRNQRFSDLVVDVSGMMLVPGTRVQLSHRNDPPTPNQSWTIQGDGHVVSTARGARITVKNHGAYVARISLLYYIDGRSSGDSSGDLLGAQEWSADIPAGAGDIVLECTVITQAPFNQYAEICTLRYPYPQGRTVTLSGGTLNTSYSVD